MMPTLSKSTQNVIFSLFIALFLTISFWTCTSTKSQQSTKMYEDVKIGAITYSWRSMSWGAKDILKFCN